MKILIIGDYNNFKLSKLYKSIKNINITDDVNSDYICIIKW